MTFLKVLTGLAILLTLGAALLGMFIFCVMRERREAQKERQEYLASLEGSHANA